MGVVELRRDLDLVEESLRAERRREFGAQDFHRDLSVMPHALGEIDGGHAAAPEFLLDFVSVGERGFQPLGLVVHATRKMEPGDRGLVRSDATISPVPASTTRCGFRQVLFFGGFRRLPT